MSVFVVYSIYSCYFCKAKGTNKRVKRQIYLSIFERKYLKQEDKGTNKRVKFKIKY